MDDLPWTKKQLETEREYLIKERIAIMCESGTSMEEAQKLAEKDVDRNCPWLKGGK